MKIQVAEIHDDPRELGYDEGVEELNTRLASGAGDYQIEGPLAVDVTYQRSGTDLLFQGTLRAEVRASCGRCLEEYGWSLAAPFTFVLTPRGPAAVDPVTEDLALSFYEGKEVDLTPLVYEHVLLALPTRPLCREECVGLCARCGANLNTGPCGCPSLEAVPRLSALRELVRSK